VIYLGILKTLFTIPVEEILETKSIFASMAATLMNNFPFGSVETGKILKIP